MEPTINGTVDSQQEDNESHTTLNTQELSDVSLPISQPTKTEDTASNIQNSNNDTIKSETESIPAPISSIPSTSATPVAVPTPVLKGVYKIDSDDYTWSGEWGMGVNYEIEGITSEFQYTLHKTNGSVDSYQPQSGTYNGWFLMKLNSVKKITENKVTINFIGSEGSDRYTVTGSGVNKFGVFDLKGYYDQINKEMVCTKVYQPKPAAPVKVVKTKSVSSTPRPKQRSTVQSAPSSSSYITPSSRRPSPRLATPSFLRENSDAPEHLSEELKYCYKILERLTNHKWAGPFVQPVDPVKLNIPDYFTIIHQPMDLGTIRDKLIENSYGDSNQFAQDIRLTFTNAFTYNKPDSDVYLMAKTLSELFERDFEQLKIRLYDQDDDIRIQEPSHKRVVKKSVSTKRTRIQSDSNVPMTAFKSSNSLDANSVNASAMKSLMTQMAEMQQQISSLKNQLNDKSNKGVEVHEFSTDEKQALHAQIVNLTLEQQLQVVEIIQSHSVEDHENNGEFEVDLDKLDDETLYALQQFIQSVSSPVPTSNSCMSPRTKQLDTLAFEESGDNSPVSSTM